MVGPQFTPLQAPNRARIRGVTVRFSVAGETSLMFGFAM